MKTKARFLSAAVCCAVLTAAMPVLPVSAEVPGETMTAVITLSDSGITATGDNVSVEGSKATITASGSYELSGTISDGQIAVNIADSTADAGTVKLFFNGVNMTGVSEAPIYIINAENTSINLVDGTENYLYDGETYTDTTAVIYAKDDLTIKAAGDKGDGFLRIEAAYHYGLHCNNDVKITGGDIKIKTALEDGLRGKTSVQIKDGTLDINAEGDGIKSTKGDVIITGGTMDIKAGNDAIQGETSVQLLGGTIKANGDRGLTCTAGASLISGASVLATATDGPSVLTSDSQPSVSLSLAAEALKDQELKLCRDKMSVFKMTPDKKFSYAMISMPDLAQEGSYELLLGGFLLADAAGETAFAITESGAALSALTVTDRLIIDGDVDCNGTTNIADAVLLAQYAAEVEGTAVTPEMVEKMDVDGDGFTTALDCSLILMYIAGLC